MLLFWLGVFFLSALGVFLFPVYAEQNRAWWPFVLGIGITLNIAGCYKARIFKSFANHQSSITTYQSFIPPHPFTIFFLAPIILGIFSFSFPYNLPLFVMGAGIMLIFTTLKWPIIRPACVGVFISGLIMSFQTISVVPYFKFAARWHEINLFTPFFYWILKGLGVECSYSQETIFVQTTQANIELVTTWEKLGLFIFITYVVGILVFLCFTSWHQPQLNVRKRIGILFSVMVAYVITRYIFMCMVFVEISKAEIFWMPIVVVASFLPLPFILWRFIKFDGDEHYTTGKETGFIRQTNQISSNPQSPIPNFQSERNPLWLVGIAMFLFVSSIVSGLFFQDPGSLKKGRILIDEFYSDWEWTDKEFDTEWYGVQSVYNYYCFADYLNHFYSVERLKQRITDDKLANYDVLIIKTPTSPFTVKELDSIEKFVENGGGLFLIGDHTNVFGTTINLNPLADRFGFRFNYDATYDLITADLHFHNKNRLYQHPIVKEMPYFLFATSCSLYAPFFADDVMIASNLKTMYLDYSRGGYFPDKNKVINYTFGLFLQSSGVKYEKGRVLVFADSTCFSNFYMHIPGKPEYALGTINWLNRTNHYGLPVKIVSFVITALSFGVIVFFCLGIKNSGRKRLMVKDFVRVILFAGLFGTSLSTLFCNILSSKSYALPKEHTPMIKIGFEEEFCNFRIPSVKLLHNPAIDFQTFYVWTQRLGYIPSLFSLNDSIDDLDVIVMINPQQYFSAKELKKIDEYITTGGKLLIIDHPKGKKSTANQILKQYGLDIDYLQYREDVDIYDGETNIGKLKSFAPTSGGEALLFTQKKDPFISIVKHGKGMIAFMACSPSFTNKGMGETEVVPNDDQQFLYKLEFWILSSLIKGDFSPFEDPTIEEK
ncbi:MAG: Gldg family protein [Candidatus Anammoxibacter sp.]